jgi:hypothetical protein
MTENDAQVEHGVEMLLLVKDQGSWRIVSQAWDKAGPSNPIPANLLARSMKLMLGGAMDVALPKGAPKGEVARA